MSDDFYTVGEVVDAIATSPAGQRTESTRIIRGAEIVWVETERRVFGVPVKETHPELRFTYLTVSDLFVAVRNMLTERGLSNIDTPIPKRLPPAPALPGSGDAQPPPVAAPTPPVDPIAALQQLAEAVRRAEDTLNQENLVIASGELSVELNVDVGGVAGAHAKVDLRIEPKQYG